jgi:hypothetical protein
MEILATVCSAVGYKNNFKSAATQTACTGIAGSATSLHKVVLDSKVLAFPSGTVL